MSQRRMIRALWVAFMAAWLVSMPVLAHPLGNTSVNIYERVEVAGDQIRIRFVMDVSEIPALEEQQFADTDDDGRVDPSEAETYLDGFWGYLQPNLQLVVASQPVPLERAAQTLTFPPGQGGLKLMRVVYDLVGPQPGLAGGGVVEATLSETTFQGVPGWHEIVVRAGDGATIVHSDAPQADTSGELTSYPEERLADPLSVREAAFGYTVAAGFSPSPSQAAGIETPEPSSSPSGGGASAPPIGPAPGRPADPLVGLIGSPLTLGAVVISVLVALALGGAHALSPGHGKTLVAAYLVGTRANLRQALWLGLTVAVTHTAGVFILGVGTYVAAEWVVPDRLVSWLAVATGLLVLALGAILVWRAGRVRWSQPAHVASHHRHGAGAHTAEHHHPHSARQQLDEADVSTPDLRRRDVAALGIVGGLVPSGSALLLLLSSIALGETAFGIILILAFGIGMALVLVGIASGIVLLRRTTMLGWERWRDPRLRRLAAAVPSISGLIVVALGIVLTAEALRNLS